MEPAGITRVLGIYAQRVITPRGSTAVSGLELMTALRPPPVRCRTRRRGTGCPATNPGSLGTEPMDPAPPEATSEHPVVVASGWMGGFLNEEAYQLVRPVDLLTDEECTLPFAVGRTQTRGRPAAGAPVGCGASGAAHQRARECRASSEWCGAGRGGAPSRCAPQWSPSSSGAPKLEPTRWSPPGVVHRHWMQNIVTPLSGRCPASSP
ncbi:hypothetical protein GCM10010274_65230 [Streptomyces lavendofoliae]|uniref:Uncharacterized protein n=1 Tax=Streptomyces lavendofoliae TaxID=67314 RepID=A0A918I627_9ACTN|nr:hypothetical protein GCM10010274_65230 [Streptomyces lavendofoliae]